MPVTIKNPTNGASIKNFLYQKKLYDLSVGEVKTYPEDLAQALTDTFGFLEKVELNGKFKCKYGDFASDTQIAVIGHEKSHTAKPLLVEGKEFITPQEKLDHERAQRLAPEETAAGLEGPGLQLDNGEEE